MYDPLQEVAVRLIRSKLVASIAVLLIAAPLWAQQRPDFSGVWRDIAHEQEVLEITQDERLIAVVRRREGENGVSIRETRSEYALDGSETVTRSNFPGGRLWAEQSRARWVAAVLEVTTVLSTDRGSFEQLILYYLTPESGNLKRVQYETEIRGETLTAVLEQEFAPAAR